MLSFTLFKIPCKISLWFPTVMLCLLLADQSGVVSFGFLAALLHETGHLVMLLLLGEQPSMLLFSFFGMRLVLPAKNRLSFQKQTLVALAGPFCNLILALGLSAVNVKTVYAAMHLMMATVNLLPILPLDGGQALYWWFCVHLPESKAKRWLCAIGWTLWGILAICGVLVFIHSGYNFTLLVMAIYVGFMLIFYKGN